MKLNQLILVLPYAALHPARGAWIETGVRAKQAVCGVVAPREGCVD